MEENYFTILKAFLFKRSASFLVEPFNEKLGRLASAGIRSEKAVISSVSAVLPKVIDEIGPQVLTIDHLYLGFLVVILLLLLCIVVFFVEVLVAKVKKLWLEHCLPIFPYLN